VKEFSKKVSPKESSEKKEANQNRFGSFNDAVKSKPKFAKPYFFRGSRNSSDSEISS